MKIDCTINDWSIIACTSQVKKNDIYMCKQFQTNLIFFTWKIHDMNP